MEKIIVFCCITIVIAAGESAFTFGSTTTTTSFPAEIFLLLLPIAVAVAPVIVHLRAAVRTLVITHALASFGSIGLEVIRVHRVLGVA